MAETKKFPNTDYLYYKPETCTHPQRIAKVEVIEENLLSADKSYTIARLIYESGEVAFGIRWNIAYDQYENEDCRLGKKVCLGFPYSRNYPTWFVLPEGTQLSLSFPLALNTKG